MSKSIDLTGLPVPVMEYTPKMQYAQYFPDWSSIVVSINNFKSCLSVADRGVRVFVARIPSFLVERPQHFYKEFQGPFSVSCAQSDAAVSVKLLFTKTKNGVTEGYFKVL